MKTSPGVVWFNSAKELYQAGRLKESRKLLITIYKSTPRFSPALDLLSIIDYKLEKYSSAKKWVDLLLKLDPNNPDLINRAVLILMKEDHFPEAQKKVQHGRELDASHPGLIYSDMKLSLQQGNQERAKRLADNIPKDHTLRIKCEQYLKKFFSERQKLQQAFTAASNKKDWKTALKVFEGWSKHNNHTADTHYDMGMLYMKFQKYALAIDHFKKCLSYKPRFHIAAFLYMWYIKLMICDWEDYDDAADTINRGVKAYLELPDPDFDIPIYILSFFQVEESMFAACGNKMYDKVMKKLHNQNFIKTEPSNKKLTDRIRIGYLSSTFWAHAVGKVYQDIFSCHNREKFEVFVYSTNHKADYVSQQIIEGADTFRDLTGTETQSTFDTIVRDGIDILVIVGGHGDDMNTDLIAMKPAAVAINAHGYNESLGGAFVDYLISDREVIDSENRQYFDEKIIFFPRCSIINSSLPPPIVQSRSFFGLPENKFIFLSAAHPRKINPDIFSIWERILMNTDDTVLWIFDYGNSKLRENLLNSLDFPELEDRIFFSGVLPYREHLGRYMLADLLLDTPIYNCHSVGIEALRNGLPFITLKGKNANSRFGASMLSTAGLKELICHSENEYVDKAISLTLDPEQMQKYKNPLNIVSNPLFDTKMNIEELEKCMVFIWDKHLKGEPTEDINEYNRKSLD